MECRKQIFVVSLITGVLALLGTGLFVVAGAGIYGSPFAGDSYFNTTLLLVLLCGPFAVLPCTLFDGQKPGYGGIVLCGLAVVEVAMITLNNVREWGFAVHDAALGSLCLGFPMFVIGTLLITSSKPHASWLNWVWWIELLLAALAAGYFLWQVGADGIGILFYLLRGLLGSSWNLIA